MIDLSLPKKFSWRSARAMRARIKTTNSDDTVCQGDGAENSMKNSTRHEVRASVRCKKPEQCSRRMPRDAGKFST